MFVFETAVSDGKPRGHLGAVCALCPVSHPVQEHTMGLHGTLGQGTGQGRLYLRLRCRHCGQVSIVRLGPNLVVPQTISRNFQRRSDVVKTMPT